jgi:murein DD-endopeptidase MepM/ murein hydrolase activator NlpD
MGELVSRTGRLQTVPRRLLAALATCAALSLSGGAYAEEGGAGAVVVSSPFAADSQGRPATQPGFTEVGPAEETSRPVTTEQILSSPFAAPAGTAPRAAARSEASLARLTPPPVSAPPPAAAPRSPTRTKAPASGSRPAASGSAGGKGREPEFVRRTARIAGVVSTTLYDAVRALGESPQLASDIADLFAWDIDFSRRAQPGDQFAVLYERLYRRGARGQAATYSGPGRILAARYEGPSGKYSAVYFEQDESRGGYYRSDGSAITRQFLAAPLKYTRVSSSFTHQRYHPILKIKRPHHGIDYAAPSGTPIVAVADGRVIFRGRAGSYGNLVKVRHANGYVSYYSHMSRFGEGLKVGDAVHQKQVIGYVGSSGLSTGPHVCFRIAKDGRFIDPASLRTPAGHPVDPENLGDFAMLRDTLFEQLDGGARIVTEEAF